jgi:undecaprenyl pyrophosphate phosphatase UppP
VGTENISTLLLGSGVAFIVALLAIKFFIGFAKTWIQIIWILPYYCWRYPAIADLERCDKVVGRKIRLLFT